MNWILIVEAAIGAVGLIEWVKGFFPLAHQYAWRTLGPVVCIALAAAFSYLPAWVGVGVLELAIMQLGYQNIIEVIKRKVDQI